MTIKQYNITGIILCALALALLICRHLSDSGRSGKAPPEPVPDAVSTNVVGPRKLTEDYSVITSNNLFHPLRGKAPAADAAKTQQDQKPPAVLNFDLKGIYHSGMRRAALIQFRGNAPVPKTGELQKADANLFYVGSEISNGYILQEVKTRSVVIIRGNEKVEVELQMLLPPEAPPGEAPPGEAPPSAAIPAGVPETPAAKSEPPKKE